MKVVISHFNNMNYNYKNKTNEQIIGMKVNPTVADAESEMLVVASTSRERIHILTLRTRKIINKE